MTHEGRTRSTVSTLRVTAAAVVLALVVAACTSGDDEAGPDTTRPGGPTTTVIDYSKTALIGVDGSTTTSIRMKGKTRLFGVVRGTKGPLPGATVRIERLVFNQVITKDVQSKGGGAWELKDVPGGRYRIRAFKAPRVAQVEPVVVFVNDGDDRRIDLTAPLQQGYAVVGTVAPNPPLIRQQVGLTAQLEFREVGGDGIVRARPVPGVLVELVLTTGRWTLYSEPTKVTSAAGRAYFELTCDLRGPPGLYLRAEIVDNLLPVEVPGCAVPASPSTTSTTRPTTSSSSTSSTLITSTSTSSTSSTTPDSSTTTSNPGRGGE